MILKYSADEARNLKSYGEFPESIKITDTVDFVGGDLDDDIEFDDVDSEGSDSAGDHDDIYDIYIIFPEMLHVSHVSRSHVFYFKNCLVKVSIKRIIIKLYLTERDQVLVFQRI